jgi:uncharacterized protein (TIGR00369 family)
MVGERRVGNTNRHLAPPPTEAGMTALETEVPDVTRRPRGVLEPAGAKLARLAPHYDGRSFLDAIRTGELPAPPVADLLGFTIREVADGRVVFELEPQEKHYNPIGMVHGGVIATLLDSAMGCALHSTLPQGVGYSTMDISVRYLRPVTVQTRMLVAVGTVVHQGRRTATAEARLVDDNVGQLYATATSTLLVVRP